MSRRTLLTHGLCLTAGAGLGWFCTREGIFPSWRLEAREDTTGSAEERVRKLKLDLPKPGKPRATLVPSVRAGDMLYVSGHVPPPQGGKPVVGKVGKDMNLKDAQEAARGIGRVILGVVRAELGSLDKVVRLVKTLGMVNCTPEFTQQPQVINAFSDLMIEVFGEKPGKGARSAVGMASLPGGVPVEIECIFQVK
jgi:enamine deaminase RidA (YjgF/YER057c/UK114 family)